MRPSYSCATFVKLVVFVFASFTITKGFDQPELLIPANTKVSLQLLSPVSTATSKKGDKFNCKVLTPAEFAGAVVEGHVRSVKRSGKANKESKIDLAFDRVTLTDGRAANFGATVLEVFDIVNVKDQGRADNEGTVKNKSTAVKTSVKRAAVGALIGAVIGGAIAGGQGAAVGAAIGASVGVTTTLAMKGPDLEFKTGTEFTVQTDGPSRVTATKSASLAPPPSRVASPSAESRIYSTQSFRVSIPENWNELASNPVTLGPAGAFRVNNGLPELTHGVMMGMAQPATGSLEEISGRFVAALIKRNPRMRQETSHALTIGGVNGLATLLVGPGTGGRTEVVAVHTALLPGSRFFYTITVAPETEIDVYRETFNRVVASIQFVN